MYVRIETIAQIYVPSLKKRQQFVVSKNAFFVQGTSVYCIDTVYIRVDSKMRNQISKRSNKVIYTKSTDHYKIRLKNPDKIR